MSEVRGHPRPTSEHRQRRNSRAQNPTSTPSDRLSTETSSTRNSGPYDRNFQQNLIDHNIFPNRYRYPGGRIPQRPSNWEEINQWLRMPLDLQPTEEDFTKFIEADAGASKEKCTSGGIPFRNLENLTDGTLIPGNPDIYYGARPEQLDRVVREELRSVLVPTTQDELPICPNFFVAAKGPDGSLAVAMRQALYDGALGARGMHRLRSYGSTQPLDDDRASTITSVYHGGQLKMYTIHCSGLGPGKEPAYYMHQLRAWAMTGDVDVFTQGIVAYRTLIFWAEEQRNEAIENANRAVQGPATEVANPQTYHEASPDSALYVTPPTGKQASLAETTANKRSRQQRQSSSPAQQKKRSRVQKHYNLPSPRSSMITMGESTGLSFRLDDHRLEESDGSGDGELEQHVNDSSNDEQSP